MKTLNIIPGIFCLLLLWACRSHSNIIVEHWTLNENGGLVKTNIMQYIPAGYLYMPPGNYVSERMYLHGYSGKIIEDSAGMNNPSFLWIDTLPDKSGFRNTNKLIIYKLRNPVISKKTCNSFFICQYEESMIQYKVYLYYLKKDSSKECYNKALPDTFIMENEHEYQFQEPYIGCLYFQHPAYENYPVVGITHSQADAYCRWKSIYVSQKICESKHILFNKDSLIVRFRLPTLTEWEYALRYNMAYGELYKSEINWKIEKIEPWMNNSNSNWYFPTNRVIMKNDEYPSFYNIYPSSVIIQKSDQKTNINNLEENVSEWLLPDEYTATRSNVFSFKVHRDTSVYKNEYIFAGGSFKYSEPKPKIFSINDLNATTVNPDCNIPIFVRSTPKDRPFSSVGFRCVLEIIDTR